MDYNFRQLTIAREYRGYSQTELAKNIPGVSQSNLSKFEKGIGMLSQEALLKIMTFLDFPVSFLNKNIYLDIEYTHYRKKSTISKRDISDFESRMRFAADLIYEMSTSIEWPKLNIDGINIDDGYSIKTIAKFTRDRLGIRIFDPISEIITILEANGILVIELDDISENIDGASIKSCNGIPIIFLNKKYSNDRKRFTIAHELGHLILHILGDFPISDVRNLKIREHEANEFAAEFLMPEDAIKDSLLGLKLQDLTSLKSYWRTSMSSIIRRAFSLNCIDKKRYTYLNIEMSRHGLKKDEGYYVTIDSPELFNEAYELHKNDLLYSDQDLAKAFSLPIDIIKLFFSKKSLLRIVR